MTIHPALRNLGLAVAALLALLAGMFAFIHTGPGERWLSGQLEEHIAGLELDGFHLGWPFRMRADAIRLSDGRGPWLEAKGFEMVWHPLRLWRGVLDIDRLVARRVDVLRLPENTGSGGSGSVPLPETLRLDEVRLPVVLAEPVLGTELGLEIVGTARMIGGGGPVELSARTRNGDTARVAGIAGTDYVDLRWYLHVPELARWSHLAGIPLSGSAVGSGVVAGRLPSPEISGRIDSGRGKADGASWDRLALNGRAITESGLWQLALQADTAAPRWRGQPLPVKEASVSLTGDLAPDSGRVRLGHGRLSTPLGSADISGVADDWGRHAVLRVTGRAAQGTLRGVVAGDLLAPRLDGVLAAHGHGVATGVPVLDRLLGPAPRARLTVALRGERVMLGPSRLMGPSASLSANGTVLPRLDLWARLTLPEAKAVLPSLTGTAVTFAHGGGTLTAPRVTGIAQIKHPEMAGVLAFDLPEPLVPRGTLSAEITMSGTPVSGQARLNGQRLDDLALASGPSQVRGNLDFRDGLRGRLSGTIPQLQQWQDKLGQPISGRVEAEAELEPRAGQSVRLSATGADLVIGGIPLSRARLGIDANGLTTATRRITVSEAAADPAGIAVALTAPAVVDWRRDGLTLAPARLSIGGGRAELAGQMRGERLNAEARLSGVPLAAFAPASGLIDGSVQADGTLAAPRLRFALDGRGLAVARIRDAGLGALSGHAEGDWHDGRLAARTQLGDGRSLRLTADGTVRVPGDGAIQASLHADGDAEKLAEALPLGAHVVTGRIEAAAAVSGTLAAPRVDGHGILRAGRYENIDAGLVVTPLQAEMLVRGDRFTVTAKGGDGGQGSMRLDGGGTLDGVYGADITLDRFTALRRDDIEASASGTLHLADGELSGALTIPRAEINAGRLKGGGPVRLDVTEINRPNSRQAPRRQPRESDAGPALALAVTGKVEHAFVRGHGLDSEWQGELTAGGTTAQPTLTGKLTAARGQLDVLGKAFKLTPDSAVIFQGGTPIDPALAVTAEAATADITAQVQVGGTAKAPDMTFTSTPPLPPDEVLARLLFGREAGKLSAFQQLQLAQMAAGGLTGNQGGFDPIGDLRGFLGLDVLGVGSETDKATGKDSPTLSAGRYIGRDTFVRVDQGTAGLGRVTVEQGVGGGFSVESYVGEQSGGGVGLSWRRDY